MYVRSNKIILSTRKSQRTTGRRKSMEWNNHGTSPQESSSALKASLAKRWTTFYDWNWSKTADRLDNIIWHGSTCFVCVCSRCVYKRAYSRVNSLCTGVQGSYNIVQPGIISVPLNFNNTDTIFPRMPPRIYTV